MMCCAHRCIGGKSTTSLTLRSGFGTTFAVRHSFCFPLVAVCSISFPIRTISHQSGRINDTITATTNLSHRPLLQWQSKTYRNIFIPTFMPILLRSGNFFYVKIDREKERIPVYKSTFSRVLSCKFVRMLHTHINTNSNALNSIEKRAANEICMEKKKKTTNEMSE